MQDNFLVEIFSSDFRFISRKAVEDQKYEFDYMSLDTNTLTVPGHLEAYRKNYIQIRTDIKIIQGIITAVEYQKLETKIQYKDLLSILDVDVYKNRTELESMAAEKFLGEMIEDNFISNEDALQNITGLRMVYTSETINATLNITDNIHNIYELALRAFRKYGIVISMELNIMAKSLTCTIGTRELYSKTIEADLKNILDVDVTIKENDEAVNKVIVIGEYDENSELYGQTRIRTFYLDATTGEASSTPMKRVLPVVFEYKTLTINEETFEDDAHQTAADIIYQEEYDNSIKVTLGKDDPLHRVGDYAIGQPCTVIKDGVQYKTIYTGWRWDKTVTLMFGVMRKEYTKNIRRVK